MAGLLTDRRADRSQLPAGDRFQDDKWLAAYQRLDILSSTLWDAVDSWTAFAIKFALCHPIVTSLIVGLNSVEQVDSVLDAADGVYPERQVFDKALEIFRAQGPISA